MARASCLSKHVSTCTHTPTHKHPHKHARAHTHTHTHARVCTHTHTRSCTRACARTGYNSTHGALFSGRPGVCVCLCVWGEGRGGYSLAAHAPTERTEPYTHVYACMFTRTRACTNIYPHTHTHPPIHPPKHTYTHIHTGAHIWMSLPLQCARLIPTTHVWCVCLCVCVYVCVYTHHSQITNEKSLTFHCRYIGVLLSFQLIHVQT